MHVSNPRSLGETGEFANSAYLSIYNEIFHLILFVMDKFLTNILINILKNY